MGKTRFLAHIATDGREQTVAEHLSGTADLCARFAASFGAEEQGRLAGMAHDIGKYSYAFQRRLRGGEKVDHSTAGAVECLKLRQQFAAFAVVGHHSGLPDGGSMGDSPDTATFGGRMNRAKSGRLEPYDTWSSEISLPNVPFPTSINSNADGMFFTRMLYSCLVDADFLDTEAFMDGAARQSGYASMDELERRLIAYISDWFPPKNELNKQRCSILERCLEQGDTQKPGLFTLTVPTGGGKTVASLAFALRHAKANGFDRVIYVIPYTSIIEQNADVFRKMLGPENVLEHHSGVLFDVEDEANIESIRMSKATENWDMPIVVTTAVQFFESLFSNRPSKCRKLHNLSNSVIIFDEAQMLPVPFLRPCVHAISQLVRHYGVSAVLCTATQPSLGPIFEEFLPGKPLLELCPSDTYSNQVFRRVIFRRETISDAKALTDKLNALPQVLCVVNLRATAQDVFKRLEPDGSFHLSTAMYPAHREAVLEKIKEKLRTGQPCRVVSTSLIEAGVDVDFPAVFREEAGLDSILQAAGRCNREGKNSADKSVVTIFKSDSTVPMLFKKNIDAGRAALECADTPDSPEAIARYFCELLDLSGKEGLDIEGILPMIASEYEAMPFEKVAKKFRLIEQNTRTIYVPLGKGEELVERLCRGERNRRLFRELGRYGVAAYENVFEALEMAGALELLEDGSAILRDTRHYDEFTGLALKPKSEVGLFL